MKSTLSHLIVASVVCMMVVIGYGMWYDALSTKSEAVEALQKTIDTKTETVSRIAAARATLAGVANDETVVQRYFVPETNIVSFINSLEVHEKTQGVTVNVLSVSTSGTKIQPSLTLTLSVTGRFDAMMRTVGAIEYAPYDISISVLSISQDTKDSWRADLKMLVGSLPAARATNSTTTALISSLPTHGFF